ncbi:MAG: flagellar motor protein MotB [Lachnospiraceae bacterium]|nr:flagellar motor protein MotB [Lachnospiraceae bacterium]
MILAKRKEDPPSGGPGWMATFSDLMNLLLCFFVLLFAMSTIDEEKFEQLVASLSASFGVLEGGSASVIEGTLISAGVDDLNDLDDFYQNLGLNAEGTNASLSEDIYEYDGKDLLDVVKDKAAEESEKMAEEIEQQAEELNIIQQIEVDFTSQYVMIVLNGALLFDPAETKIRTDSIPLVDKVGDILKNYSSSMIEITGYTDNVPLIGDPKYDDNWDLSTARAKTVLMYLVNNKGMSLDKMKSAGRGENDPIATNDTAEGRAQNRRVEIKIYNEYNLE